MAYVAQVLWRWDFFFERAPEILRAAEFTFYLVFGGIFIAMILGLFLAIARRSDRRWIKLPVGGFVEFIRSTPLLVQLYVVFFIFPIYTPLEIADITLLPRIRIPPLTTGILVIGIHYATYTSEVYRAGIDAVVKGQWEAATALNFRKGYVWRRIILPQAIPPVVPALGNYLISAFKDTPQVFAIGVLEVLTTAQRIGTRTFRFVEPLTTAAVFFIVLSYVSGLLIRKIERRYGSAVEMPAGGI
jgi:polar amino acid transport system permease protein